MRRAGQPYSSWLASDLICKAMRPKGRRPACPRLKDYSPTSCYNLNCNIEKTGVRGPPPSIQGRSNHISPVVPLLIGRNKRLSWPTPISVIAVRNFQDPCREKKNAVVDRLSAQVLSDPSRQRQGLPVSPTYSSDGPSTR